MGSARAGSCTAVFRWAFLIAMTQVGGKQWVAFPSPLSSPWEVLPALQASLLVSWRSSWWKKACGRVQGPAEGDMSEKGNKRCRWGSRIPPGGFYMTMPRFFMAETFRETPKMQAPGACSQRSFLGGCALKSTLPSHYLCVALSRLMLIVSPLNFISSSWFSDHGSQTGFTEMTSEMFLALHAPDPNQTLASWPPKQLV